MKLRDLFFMLLVVMAAVCDAQNVFNVMKYGAKGNGTTDDARAIQRAIDACSKAGGGQVLFPTGHTFMSGPIELKSNIDLHLAVGATLIANPDESIYKLSAFGKNEGEGMMWIWCDSIENLSITGRGTIDGNGVAFMGAELLDSYELKPVTTFDPRPHVLTLMGVNHLTIRDVTIRKGAYWTVHLVGCYDALIEGISLKNNLKIRNGDGIDIDHSRKVRIANCFIESGDDCICLKNRREYEKYGPCQDVVVTNCVMTGRSCAIKIGSENMDSISNVLFDNCVIRNSNRGLGIQNRDEGTVTNVVFSNIVMDCLYFSDVWWGKAEPIYVTSYPRRVGNHKDAGWRFPKGATEGKCGEVSNITFHNIIVTGENGCFIGGDTEGKVHDIVIDNVDLNLVRRTDYPGGVYDCRPRVGDDFIKADARDGIYIEKAKNVTTRNFRVKVDDSFLRSELKSDPNKAGSSYLAYPRRSQLKPLGDEYEPIYLWHYGRHGSRYLTSEARYKVVIDALDQHELTEYGKEIKRRMQIVWNDARGHAGELTSVGAVQHRAIAQRMMQNFPELFREGTKVSAASSTSDRCIKSMEAFCSALKEVNPKLAISQTSDKRNMVFINNETKELKTFTEGDAWKKELSDFLHQTVNVSRVMDTLFVRPEEIKNAYEVFGELYWIASDMQNVALDGVGFYDLFTADELYNYWRYTNYKMYATNGPSPLNGGVIVDAAQTLYDHLIAEAKAAIASGSPRVDLHFGHDSALLRLLTRMGIADCNVIVDDRNDVHLSWQDFRFVPMAANLQLVFYRNRLNQKIYMRIILNEEDKGLAIHNW